MEKAVRFLISLALVVGMYQTGYSWKLLSPIGVLNPMPDMDYAPLEWQFKFTREVLWLYRVDCQEVTTC